MAQTGPGDLVLLCNRAKTTVPGLSQKQLQLDLIFECKTQEEVSCTLLASPAKAGNSLNLRTLLCPVTQVGLLVTVEKRYKGIFKIPKKTFGLISIKAEKGELVKPEI